MSKLGYLIALVAILGFGAYALWPTATVVGVKVFAGSPPSAYSVRVAATSAAVGKEQTAVTVGSATYVFPTDSEKSGRIWSTLGSIEVPASKVIHDIGEAQLAPYGLDSTREAAAVDGSARLRWGGSDGQAYIWNAGTRSLMVIDPQVLTALDAAAAPPIRATALSGPMSPTRLTIDGLTLIYDEGRWLAELFRNRPPFNGRVATLMSHLMRLSIDDLGGVQTFGLPVVGTVQLSEIKGTPADVAPQFASGPQPARTITIYSDGARGAVAISGFPAQPLNVTQMSELRGALAAFARNPLLDIYSLISRDDVLRVDVVRGRGPAWSLRRREKPSAIGGYFWDVAWSNGRESAPDEAVDELVAMVSAVSVRDPQPDSKALAVLPDQATVVTITSERPNAPPVRFAVANGELITAEYRGRLDDDGKLDAALMPERFLDQRLTRRDPTRVAKIQRRFRSEAPPRDEVVARSEGGTWICTYPASSSTSAPASASSAPGAASSAIAGAAVDRLVRVLVSARVGNISLINGDGVANGARALLAAPDFELDVRFAAVAGGQAANDDTDLDLTAAQDWGFAARKEGPRWQCVDKDLGLLFTLDDETIEEFRRPFTIGQVFPVVGSVVTRVEIRRLDGSLVTLVRDGATWTAADGAGASATPADAIAVRRYFRTLGELTVADGATLDARLPEPPAQDIVASVTCLVPAISGDRTQPTELLTLAVLRATAGGTPVHVWSNRGGSRFPRGRALLPAAAVAEVLPAAQAFGR
jgi:hypothetical protein